MISFWRHYAWQFGVLFGAALLLGLLSDALTLWLLLASLTLLVWHGFQYYRLHRWLRHGDLSHPPPVNGLWGEIYNHIYRQRKRARKRKRKLVDMLNQFYDLVSALPDATVVLDEHGAMSWWNSAATKLLGLKTQDRGRRIDNLIRHPLFTAYILAGDYEKPVEFSSPIDESVELSLQIISYGKKRRLVVAQDVSNIHRLEKIRQDFVANVSHELRTPLTVLNGFLENMQDSELECPPHWQRSLQLMDEQTERMQALVEDLLFLSRLEARGQAMLEGVVDVPALLSVIRAEALALKKDNHAVEIVLTVDDTLWLSGGAMELRSAFSNLVVNAIRYSPEAVRVEVSWYRGDANAYLAVKDHGVGVGADQIPRLTERFYRVDRGRAPGHAGTGLGLAIVKHVMQRHHGELQIESEVGVGSTFTCVFPGDRIINKKPSSVEKVATKVGVGG